MQTLAPCTDHPPALFISNIEGSLLLTTHAQVASDFGRFSESQWLIVAYPLAVAAAEPIVGSLSNGIGRRRLLLISYVVFAAAALICGVAPHFAVFILGRVVAGIGGSGLFAMVNLIISDLVPLRDLATYRGYLQAAMASGRLLGGPLGGFLTQRLGWRIVFTAQTPLLLLAAVCCAVLIPRQSPSDVLGSKVNDAGRDDCSEATTAIQPIRIRIWATIRHVDFGGAFLLVCTITLALLSFHFLSDGDTVRDLRLSVTLGLCLLSGGGLFVVERYLTLDPMLSRRLLMNPVVVGTYLMNTLGVASQSCVSCNAQFIISAHPPLNFC
jgi:MFS family permease